MEAMSKQASVEYQKRSLVEFLLGDHRSIGWLDAYSLRSYDRFPSALQELAVENRSAAA
jgi:hypothetical protein